LSRRVAYLDCSSGVAGDMLLASLLDAGVPLADLQGMLAEIGVAPHVALSLTPVKRGAFRASYLQVTVAPGAPTWRLDELEARMSGSGLPSQAQRRALDDLARLLDVEARLHNVANELHELGSLDTVVDVVGFHFACTRLAIDSVVTSPINVGGGEVTFAHGTFGVPAPATAELLRSVPIRGDDAAAGELATPTGAVLVSSSAVGHGPLPPMRIERIGYGAGRRETSRPNIVRCLIGTTDEVSASLVERVLTLETNIDDMNPQLYETLSERLFALGALDVSLASVIGKRGRPATIVTVIAPPACENELTDALYEESTTLGVRVSEVKRVALVRRIVRMTTSLGPVDVKISRLPSGRERRTAEYRDVVARARENGIAVVDAARLIAGELELPPTPGSSSAPES
jgi:uncharacterized protein (TIGR00299 family) protein